MHKTRGRRGARGRRVASVVQKRVSLKSPPPDGWNLGYIKKLKPLPGRGDSVFLAEVNSSGERFVLKKLDKNTGVYPASASAQLERDLHMSFKHPNVIRTLASFETESSIYLMMEYAESGDLFDAVLRPEHNEFRASQYLRDVILGLQYIHSLNVVHRDVKAENIVLTSNGQCKLIDFGFATRIRKGNRYLNDKLIAGTIDYLSPEIIRKRPYNQGIDVWAIGVLAYILVCRHVPFAPHSSQLETTFAKRSVVTRAILNIEIYRGSSYQGVSSVAKDFFERILVKDPNARMTLDEMLLHPFLNRVEMDAPAAFSPESSNRVVAVSKNSSPPGVAAHAGGVAMAMAVAPAVAHAPQDETAQVDGHTVADLSSVRGHAVVRRRSSSSSSGRTCSTCSGHSMSSGSGRSGHSSGSCSSSGGSCSGSGSDSDGSMSRRSSAAGLCGSRAEEGESDEAEFQAVSAGTRSARSTSNASQHSYTSQHSHHSHTSQHMSSASHVHSHHSRTSSRGSVSAALVGVTSGGGGGGSSPLGSGGGGGGGGVGGKSPCHLSRSDDLPVGLPSLPYAADVRNSPPNPDSGSSPYKQPHIAVPPHDLMVSHLDQQFSSMDLDAENPDNTTTTAAPQPSSSRGTARAIGQQHHPSSRTSRVPHTRHSSDEESNPNKPRARHKFGGKKGGDVGKHFDPA